MDFNILRFLCKNRFNAHYYLCFIFLLSGCGKATYDSSTNSNIIGSTLEAISQGYGENGETQTDLIIFDETTRYIHHFDTSNMQLKNSTVAEIPAGQHFIFYFKTQDYIFDLSDSHLSILNSARQRITHSLQFHGIPVSVAAQEQLGLFVLYDDLKSTAILKLDAFGHVEKSWTGGPLLSNGESVLAGELNSNGKLVLALTGGIIAIVDVEQSLLQQKWIFTQFTPGIGDIHWLAPIPNQPDLFLMQSSTDVDLINIATTTLIDHISLSGYFLKQLSKSAVPHLIVKDSSNQTSLIFVENNAISIKNIVGYYPDKLVYSGLDSSQTYWTLVENTANSDDYFSGYHYNNVDYDKRNRKLKKIRFSDMLVMQNLSLANHTQIRVLKDAIFSLYPSQMGFASIFDLNTSQQKESKYFNMNFLK
jgi:hypothetical protein